MRLRILKYIAITAFIGCSDNKLPIEATYPKEISIYSDETKIEKLENILAIKKLVKLEFSNQSQISSIGKVVIFNNNIIVFDSSMGRVLLFDKNGKFIKSIIASGNGPSECSSVTSISYDYDKQELLIGCRGKRAILRFDEKGSYLGKIRVNFGVDKLAYLGDGAIAVSTGFYNDSYHNIMIINKFGEIINSDFRFPEDTRTMLFDFLGVLSENALGALYVSPTSSEIYQITKDGNSYLKYSINFDNLQWPESNKYDFFKFLNREVGSVSVLRDKIIENDNIILFNYLDRHNLRTGYYFKKTNKLFTYRNLEKSQFVSVIMREGPVGYSRAKGYFISAFSPYDMIDIFQNGKKPFNKLSSEFYNLLEVEPDEEEMNPVLLFYEFSGPN